MIKFLANFLTPVINTVLLKIRPTRPKLYRSKHNLPGSKYHTGTQVWLINLALTQALNDTQRHKHSYQEAIVDLNTTQGYKRSYQQAIH